MRPHHARQEEEHQAEEGEAEHGRQLLADEEVAHRHAEEDDRQQERQHEDQDGVEVAQLGQLEPTGDEPHGHDDDGSVDEQVAECAADGHAVDAACAQAGRDILQRALVLAGVAAEQADAEEQRLVHHQHEQRRQEEAAVAPRGVEGRDFLVGDRLQLYLGVLAGEACHCVALQLDGVHLVDEHGVGAQQGGLVVVERAHVGKDADMGRLHGGQPLREVLGEVEDGVYLVVLQQLLRFVHIAALVFDVDFRRGVELVDEAFALRAHSLVDHRHRQVLHVLGLVHVAEDEGVEQGGDEEDEQHSAVREHMAHLGAQRRSDVVEVHSQFLHCAVFLRVCQFNIAAPSNSSSPKASRAQKCGQQ